jgi:hypothetical protein
MSKLCSTIVGMAIARHQQASPGTARVDELSRLRSQIDRVRGRRVEVPLLPVHPAIGGLLPERGLRPGSVYAIDSSSPSLMLGLMAQASRAGSWCGIVGVSTLGAEAAEEYGLDLERLVLVPEPGARWFTVASALAEVLPIVAVSPAGRPGEGDVARLAARLRDRGTTLITLGAWPGADALLSVSDPRWRGLGEGHGYLAEREVTVTASSRRFPVPRSTRMLLPDAAGTAAASGVGAGVGVGGAGAGTAPSGHPRTDVPGSIPMPTPIRAVG